MIEWIVSIIYRCIIRWYILFDMNKKQMKSRERVRSRHRFVRIVQDGYSIQCFMTYAEQNMLKYATRNHKIINELSNYSLNKAVIELTVDFNLFYYLCLHKRFPTEFNVTINETVS